jgi:hypothetical protein
MTPKNNLVLLTLTSFLSCLPHYITKKTSFG